MNTITVVSHYPKIGDTPGEQILRRALSQFDRQEITADELERVKDEVTRRVIAEQIEAGCEVVTDGQIRWDDPLTYLARKIKGFRVTGLLRYFDTNTFYRQPICEGELASPDSLVVKDFQFANAVSSVPVKALLTGPYTFAKLSQDQHYKDFEKFASKLAAFWGEETKRLVQAGATIVQFDEPALLSHKREFPLFKRIWEKLAAYFPQGLETILFLNYGDLREIYSEVLGLPVTTLGLDLAGKSENWKLLRQGRFGKKLLAGIVDARNTKMETEEELREKLEELANLLPGNQFSVSPNYGLEFLPRNVAKKKLSNLSKVAREFRSAKVKV
jgi:5-methyltetrahydropteroyltriglutamate--homocysteine methyltransferase